MFWAEIWKNIKIFIWKFTFFLVVKFSVYLNGRVFVMTQKEIWETKTGKVITKSKKTQQKQTNKSLWQKQNNLCQNLKHQWPVLKCTLWKITLNWTKTQMWVTKNNINNKKKKKNKINKIKQEAYGPRFVHLSDIATADMQMFPIIYAKIQP